MNLSNIDKIYCPACDFKLQRTVAMVRVCKTNWRFKWHGRPRGYTYPIVEKNRKGYRYPDKLKSALRATYDEEMNFENARFKLCCPQCSVMFNNKLKARILKAIKALKVAQELAEAACK